jgi:hypothetical protein
MTWNTGACTSAASRRASAQRGRWAGPCARLRPLLPSSSATSWPNGPGQAWLGRLNMGGRPGGGRSLPSCEDQPRPGPKGPRTHAGRYREDHRGHPRHRLPLPQPSAPRPWPAVVPGAPRHRAPPQARPLSVVGPERGMNPLTPDRHTGWGTGPAPVESGRSIRDGSQPRSPSAVSGQLVVAA